MIEFKILKKSERSGARLGILKTPHGEVMTPSLVPVATKATIKTLTTKEIEATKTQITISNTFHLHLRPGEDIVKRGGGLNKFGNLPVPTMTDSGGFQVFSLGFGHDLQVGKVLKMFPGKKMENIIEGSQPKGLKITEDGVHFKSPIDGRALYIGPKESIRMQEKIGADIIFAFDECTPPTSSEGYARKALDRTHTWAKICTDVKKSDQALFGIVQGSRYKKLRYESADYINSLPFNGFGIGGDLGESKKTTDDILSWVMPRLDEKKPKHMLGIGYLEDMVPIIKRGIDTFDCTVPTHLARRGIAFTSSGRLDMGQSRHFKSRVPLDRKCECETCQSGYTRSYICHLIRAGEITGGVLLTIHNLHYFNTYVEEIRKKIKQGKL